MVVTIVVVNLKVVEGVEVNLAILVVEGESVSVGKRSDSSHLEKG